MAQKSISGPNWLQRIQDNFTELYTSVAGALGLASNAETLAGVVSTKAVSPASLENALGFTDVWSFVGSNGAGACTLTGAKVGDKVMSVAGLASGTAGNQAAKFEAVITVNDQIQQSDAGNLSANVYLVYLYRKS